VGDDALPNVPAGDLASPAVQVEGAARAARLQACLMESLERLSPQDRLVMRFRFEDQVSVADIARMLKLDQKPLYRRIDDLLTSLRKSLESAGFAWPEVQQMIERGQCHLCLSRPGENGRSRPSQREAQV
jgi:RNA polymerase sigma factor for flagellar operon FliA